MNVNMSVFIGLWVKSNQNLILSVTYWLKHNSSHQSVSHQSSYHDQQHITVHVSSRSVAWPWIFGPLLPGPFKQLNFQAWPDKLMFWLGPLCWLYTSCISIIIFQDQEFHQSTQVQMHQLDELGYTEQSMLFWINSAPPSAVQHSPAQPSAAQSSAAQRSPFNWVDFNA